MPLLIAVVLYGGTFFGYSAQDEIRQRVRTGYQTQQHWLELKAAATEKVRAVAIGGTK